MELSSVKERKIRLATSNGCSSEWYDSLSELLLDLSLEYGKQQSTVSDFIDIKWSTGERQRLYKGNDY